MCMCSRQPNCFDYLYLTALSSFFPGNPLECNCLLRPVAYWLTSVGRVQGRAKGWDEAREDDEEKTIMTNWKESLTSAQATICKHRVMNDFGSLSKYVNQYVKHVWS
jgi:hypothetical protein